jgi:hypothetical protein
LEEVGDVKPTSLLYKPSLFEANGKSFRAELCWRKAKPKSVCCREAFEVETLSDRFWELGASVWHAVSFAGFLRSGTTRPDQSCSLWALLRCNFEHLIRNKEASPTGKRPGDVGKHCAELRYQPAFLWFVVLYCFQIYTCVFD